MLSCSVTGSVSSGEVIAREHADSAARGQEATGFSRIAALFDGDEVAPAAVGRLDLRPRELAHHSRVQGDGDLRAVVERRLQVAVAVEDPRAVDDLAVDAQDRLVDDHPPPVELELDRVALVLGAVA